MTITTATRHLARARVGGPGWDFNAAHTGLHDGTFEPLHGHTYQVTLTVWGEPDDAGMIADFAILKSALRATLTPLKRRTLLATSTPGVLVAEDDELVHVTGGGAFFTLPRRWVALLPIASTSTEALAGYLADQLAVQLAVSCPSVERLETMVTESAECAATVEIVLR
ncbi:6-carboxytetrahydropterin synthase [Promicromonospora sp. NPDC023987]|uniref:6-pyruvoyl trahydropterin synthase family protein n=1 Tax=Promicromonospora sp. NPDC023987 TaxID=3155360 RepID=UPI0034055792